MIPILYFNLAMFKDDSPQMKRSKITIFSIAFVIYACLHACRSTWAYSSGEIAASQSIPGFTTKFLSYINFTYLVSFGLSLLMYDEIAIKFRPVRGQNQRKIFYPLWLLRTRILLLDPSYPLRGRNPKPLGLPRYDVYFRNLFLNPLARPSLYALFLSKQSSTTGSQSLIKSSCSDSLLPALTLATFWVLPTQASSMKGLAWI